MSDKAQFASMMNNSSGKPAKKKKLETSIVPEGNNEVKAVKDLFVSIVASKQLQELEKETQNDIYERLEQEHGIEKKVARDLARILHKGNKEHVDEHNRKIAAILNKIA